MHSIVKKEDLIEYRGGKEFRQKYQMKVDRFFFIPEEVHILPGSSSIMVRNNSIIGVDTQITLNIRSRVAGLVRVERKKKRIELKIFSGDIHFPGETDKISRHSGVLIPPGTGKLNSAGRRFRRLLGLLLDERRLSAHELYPDVPSVLAPAQI